MAEAPLDLSSLAGLDPRVRAYMMYGPSMMDSGAPASSYGRYPYAYRGEGIERRSDAQTRDWAPPGNMSAPMAREAGQYPVGAGVQDFQYRPRPGPPMAQPMPGMSALEQMQRPRPPLPEWLMRFLQRMNFGG